MMKISHMHIARLNSERRYRAQNDQIFSESQQRGVYAFMSLKFQNGKLFEYKGFKYKLVCLTFADFGFV